jgi:hypothetical protein
MENIKCRQAGTFGAGDKNKVLRESPGFRFFKNSEIVGEIVCVDGWENYVPAVSIASDCSVTMSIFI